MSCGRAQWPSRSACPGSVTTANLRTVRHEGHYLLGFNEPDNAGQSNMTVSQALSLWPRLMATKMTLGSPAVASGAATKGGWLDQFTVTFPSAHQQAAFVTAATSMPRRLPYVQRYAWLALPVSSGPNGDGTAGLFRTGAVATAAGRAFEAVKP